MKTLLLFNILIVFLLSSGCSSRKSLAPVHDHSQPSSTKVSYHIVAQGETLYSIAWRYNLNYRALAKHNKINSLYTIYPGQKISLREDFGTSSRSNQIVMQPSKTVSGDNKNKKKVVLSNTKEQSKNKSSVVDKSPIVPPESNSLVWAWPLSGEILTRFQSKTELSKGVDIAAKLGQPVVAASPGKVVYSGDGLRGYGNLIILKHNDSFLSAYAHNRRLLVKEGDMVKQKQKIAEAGRSGTDSVKLHFEIRRDGKPVDPLRYLPTTKK